MVGCRRNGKVRSDETESAAEAPTWGAARRVDVKRILGRSGIEVPAVGMGCWAIGGPWEMMGAQAGWGVVDDAESTRAIHAALDLGA